jgi:hypothetical protein
MEVRNWRSKRAELAFTLDLGHAISGTVQLYLPWQPTEASINGASVALQPNDCSGIYSVHMSDADGKEIKITA